MNIIAASLLGSIVLTNIIVRVKDKLKEKKQPRYYGGEIDEDTNLFV